MDGDENVVLVYLVPSANGRSFIYVALLPAPVVRAIHLRLQTRQSRQHLTS
jgi:hypothetical protein